ncbi:MAG: hypothetical protein U0163_00180 [Gemmatimonadaceae bacterium]
MPDPFITSDPNAWLRPYWQQLHDEHTFFANLAPELRANALADLLAPEHPAKAAEIRAWTPVTCRAMLAVLDQALSERHTARETELWRMTNGARELRCVAVYTRVGLDLRLLDGTEIQRTELFALAPLLLATSRRWAKEARQRGWRPFAPNGATAEAVDDQPR